jgi:hypothetical protein
MKMNSILKGFLIKYFPAIIFFILKNYFGLDFINDFNPFSSETTKFFNGNSGEGSSINPPSEGEGSNRQNNPQDSSINSSSHREASGVIETTPTNEELDKEESRLSAEENRLRIINQKLEHDETMLDLFIKDNDEDIRNSHDLNEIEKNIDFLNEEIKRIDNRARAYDEAKKKFDQDLAKLASRKLEKSINERNNK